MKRGFTLTEMLLVIAIIGIMAGLALSGLAGAMEQAREQRTRSIINKIDTLIMERCEGYRTRAVPIRIPPRLGAVDAAGLPTLTDPRTSGQIRLYALRDLMRMELPERVTDISDGPAVIYQKGSPYNVTVQLSQPSLLKNYRRCAQRALGTNWATLWTDQYQGSECLYLILSTMHDGDKQATDFFLSEEIGDTDGDGMKEILDGWGRPIEFLRWAPGFTSQNGCLTSQTSDYITAPDPFDPVKVDPRWTDAKSTTKPFALKPLIVSAGRDKQFDYASQAKDSSGNNFRYFNITPIDDPYYTGGSQMFGTPIDFDSDGISRDNITNHYQAP